MKNTQGIFWRVFRAYAIVIVLTLAVVAISLRPIISNYITKQEEDSLQNLSDMITLQLKNASESTEFSPELSESDLLEIANDKFSKFLPHSNEKIQASIVLNGDRSEVTSTENFTNEIMGFANIELNRADDQNLMQAQGKGIGNSPYLFQTSRIIAAEKDFFLILAIPNSVINSKINSLYFNSLIGFILALTVGACAAYMFTLNFAKPLEQMQQSATRFGRRDFSSKVPSPHNFELNGLADALNTMAQQLERRIGEITQQRNEQMAVLESLTEGVLAIDQNERILSINHIGARLLGVNANEVQGTLVQEFLRHIDLQRYIQNSLEGNYTQDDEFPQRIQVGRDTLLEVRSAPLRDQDGQDIGTIIIMVDITRLNQLENLRKDFVANVSHELRTPITSIKGFTETLLDGALEEDPEQAKKFLEVIDRQSTRLGQVIEDLLKLSRLDRQEELIREPIMLDLLLNHTIELCTPEAQINNTNLVCECLSSESVDINETLIEQALTNLVSNAIRYAGGQGKKVELRGEIVSGKLKIQIIDEGPGISKEHLPRLFERFYRIDKARSRDVGGTGLGLSIVKHVVVAHHGNINVDSELNKGTTFTIEIPVGT